MPRHPNPLPSSLGAVFLSSEARAAGATAGRLGAADLARPFRGVRARPGPPAPDTAESLSPDERARAALMARIHAHALVMPAHSFYIGDAARAVHRLPFPDADRATVADLEVAVLAPHRGLRRPGIRSIQVRPQLAHSVVVDGVRVATPATMWAMAARDQNVRGLVALGDAILRIPRDDRGRRHPELQLATPGQLRAAIEAGRRMGGVRLRTALPYLRTGSMSVLETEWRLNFIDAGGPEPELDMELRDQRGRLLGISDGAFPSFRVAVEVEGDGHRVSRAQWNRDIEKYAAYAAIGWEVIRVTSAHIRGPGDRDVRLVRNGLIRRGWTP